MIILATGSSIKDLDFKQQLLVIREPKFYKSCLVPCGLKLGAVLARHLRQRQAAPARTHSEDEPLFSLRAARPINPGTVSPRLATCRLYDVNLHTVWLM